jgi:tetratricopeptide (TPR) repeat protein
MICIGCSIQIPDAANFCPACGVSQQSGYKVSLASFKTKVLNKLLLFSTLIAIPLTALGLISVDKSRGSIPTVSYEDYHRSEVLEDPVFKDVEYNRLLAKVKSNPNSKAELTELAQYMSLQLSTTKQIPNDYLFSLIDLLKQILKIDAQDKDALLTLANITYNRQVFDKAAEYYAQYLKYYPTDDQARSIYASTLTFLGKFSSADEELKGLLKRNPKDFAILANATVNLAAWGKPKEALAMSKKAEAQAPDQASREKFTQFLAHLLDSKVDSKADTAKPTDSNKAGDVAQVAATAMQEFDKFMRANPIAGPKFVRSELLSDGTLNLYMHEFPVEQMPAAVREKFIGSIDAKLLELGIKKSQLKFVAAG